MRTLAFSWIALTLATAPGFAGCVDLSGSGPFSLTRHEPYFKITNTISDDGQVTEERVARRNGSTDKVTTRYWNGVIAVDRQSKSSHIQLKIASEAKTANLKVAGKAFRFPMSILVNGNEVDQGSFVIQTIRKTNLSVGGCDYPVMVVRTSMERKNGAPINEEALLSLDAGMLLGNVAMTSEWKARSAVFFDEIETN